MPTETCEQNEKKAFSIEKVFSLGKMEISAAFMLLFRFISDDV